MLAELGISSFEIRQNLRFKPLVWRIHYPRRRKHGSGKAAQRAEFVWCVEETDWKWFTGVWHLCGTNSPCEDHWKRTLCLFSHHGHYRQAKTPMGVSWKLLHTTGNFKGIGDIPMTFIRAPHIQSAAKRGGNSGHSGRENCCGQTKKISFVTAFHPELDHDLGVHRYFADMIKKTSRRYKNKHTKVRELFLSLFCF